MLYQMNKNMNKRFFAEFLAALSLKVNPEADDMDDPEINIIINKDGNDDDDYYDIDESGEPSHGTICFCSKLSFLPGQPMMEIAPNPHSNWKIPWKKRSTMFGGKR